MSISASASSATAEPESAPSLCCATRFSMSSALSNFLRSMDCVVHSKPSTRCAHSAAASASSVASSRRVAPYASRNLAAAAK